MIDKKCMLLLDIYFVTYENQLAFQKTSVEKVNFKSVQKIFDDKLRNIVWCKRRTQNSPSQCL